VIRIVGSEGFVGKNKGSPAIVDSKTEDFFYFFITVNQKDIVLTIAIGTEGIGNIDRTGFIDSNGGSICGGTAVFVDND